MRFVLSIFLLLAFFNRLHAESTADSVIAQYKSPSLGYGKVRILAHYMARFETDEALYKTKAIELINRLRKEGDQNGVDHMNLFIAERIGINGDYVTALDMSLPILTRFGEQEDSTGILHAYIVIITAYGVAENHMEAIAYIKKAIPFVKKDSRHKQLAYGYNNLAAEYAQALIPDSGLVYAQKAVAQFTESKDSIGLGMALATVAENYMVKKDYELALAYLRKSMKITLIKQVNNEINVASVYNNLAQAFLGSKLYDSVYVYAKRSLQLSTKAGNKQHQLKSYEYLYKCFDASHVPDSSNTYFRLATAIKDSMFNQGKVKAFQSAIFREQLRQEEIASEKRKEEERRIQNLQYASIAIGIFVFIFIFLLLSQRFVINTKVIEFFGVIALLLVFEFLNLLLHPFLERITHHTPVLMLIFMVTIAALLVPFHHRTEKWATEKLIEKNKAIRLAKAKREIEKLESSLKS